MFEYTQGNHFKFGYNGMNLYQQRASSTDRFTAEYGQAKKNLKNWRQANEDAALDIYEKKEGDLWLLLSGGMDSEICLRSFLDQGLPLKTVTLRYKDIDQNEELIHVDRLIRDFNIDHQFVDIALLDFIESSKFYKTVDLVKCVSPIIGCQLWLANSVAGTPIIAQGEVHLKKEIPDDYVPGVSPYLPSDWYLYESERLCSIYMNFLLQNKSAIPGFFQYTPEQTYTFLSNNPVLKKLVTNQIPGKLGTRSSKNIMSAQFYPEIPVRTKLHGWESIQKVHDDLREKLALRFPDSDDSYKIEYHSLVRHLSKFLPTDRPCN